jgi:RNA polymerase sigma-70 factor (ECF subfamily)
MARFPRIQRWIDSEDVLQNALLRMIRSLKDVRPNSMREFYGLAAMQMRRELLDLTKSLYGPQGEGANHDSVLQKDGSELVRVEPTAPSDDEVQLEKWCQFHEHVEKLPIEEREVVGLIFYHGWSQTQVAELFSVSVRTVQRWWQSGISRLREGLSDGSGSSIPS